MALAGWVTIAVPLAMALRDILVSYTRIVQAMVGGKTSARLSGKLKAIVQGGGVFVLVVLAAGWLGLSGEVGRLIRGIAAGAILAVTAWSLADYLRGAAPGIKALRK
jgi:phosphatidylglycerophosphate synthase